MSKTSRIELLFLLSLLVFLAALVYGFAVRSGLKMDDATKNNLVAEYLTALRLFAADHHGEYPYPGFISKPVCLGSGNPGGQCQGGGPENIAVEADLAS